MSRPLFVAATALLWCQSTLAQPGVSAAGKNIPVRPLGPVIATSKDTLGPRIVTRGLADGSVLVGVFAYGTPPDLGRRRVKLFDPTLQHITQIFDSTSMPQLIRYFGDTTLALDQPSRTIIVLDAKGKTVRTMALPRQQDFPGLVGFIRTPWIDPKGRLIYQGTPQRPPLKPGQSPLLNQVPFFPDSAPIVRGDFDTRKIDTITKIRIAQPGTVEAKEENGSLFAKAILDPTGVSDEWTMLPDGTRITATINFDAITMDKMPDYEAPIGPGSVRADLDGNVWIVPRTSAAAKGGLLYDVVNRKGEIVERVQFPAGVALVGFGPGGIVYLNTVVGNNGFLSVAKIR